MGDNEPESSIVSNVAGIDSHPRLKLAIQTNGHASFISDFAKRAVTIVAKQEIRHVIVGDENILPPVIVVVEGDYAKPVATLEPDSRFNADVGERSISVVVKKRRRLPVIDVRVAVTPHPGRFVAAPKILLWRPIHVVRNDKVEFAVVVVVEPRSARCPLAKIG